MRKLLNDHRVFLKEFRRNFTTTGAILPSGRPLARALARYVRPNDAPLKILEVGPGTGPVTRQLVEQLRPRDTLHLVELNESFVQRLRERFDNDPEFAAVKHQVQVFHCPVEELANTHGYDRIISGLPFNNFQPRLVAQIVHTLQELLLPGGYLSFFEYFGIRPARERLGRREDRLRIQGISSVLSPLLARYEFSRELIWQNVPPAWVHHLRFQTATVTVPPAPVLAAE